MNLAIIQARMSSTRLPDKVLKRVMDKPLLELLLERVQRSQYIDKIIVATSTATEDEKIAQLCVRLGVECFRGNLDDVLDRFYQAALTVKPQYVIRLTADCPLIDPSIVDSVIKEYLRGSVDYVSNTLRPTYPDGLDAEVFSFSALEQAWKEAKLPSEREHVTPYIWKNSDFKNGKTFRSRNVSHRVDLSSYRWTVDEPADFEFVRNVYEALYPSKPNFDSSDILAYLIDHPEINALNKQYTRNEGLQKSFEEDRKIMTKIPKSLLLQERAKSRIPGMTQLLSKRPDLFSLGVWPGYFKKAKGVEVWDLDDNWYIDMSIGGIGANVLGYADPDVDAAVMEAVKNGTSSSLNCPEEIELADLLCEIHPWAEKVRYARTGGESMVVAVRIARAVTGRDKIAFCGYHGWHDWYLAANIGTENALGEHLLPGLSPVGVPKGLAGTAFPFRYNHIEELEAIINGNKGEIAAIVMEPIRNDWPNPSFLKSVRDLVNKTGAVLIIDEISAGFRMNSGGAHLILGIEPDIAVFSKALGNGYPIGAIIGKGRIMDAAQTTFISSTYWTERIGPVAAIATIRKHRQVNAGKHLMKIGEQIQEGWKRIADKYDFLMHVGGIPPLSHFSFESEDGQSLKAYFIQLMLERGFLASTSFYSMYAHQEEHVEKYLVAMDESFSEIAKAKRAGNIEKLIIGKPAAVGFKRLI